MIYGTVSVTAEAEMFARAFSELSDIDQKEIMNLIEFKRKRTQFQGAVKLDASVKGLTTCLFQSNRKRTVL